MQALGLNTSGRLLLYFEELITISFMSSKSRLRWYSSKKVKFMKSKENFDAWALNYGRQITKAVVQRCSVKKAVLKNSPKLTGKHMCQSIFLRKVTGLNSSSSMTFQVLLFGNLRAGEMDFKVEGPWNTDKYCRSQENGWPTRNIFWILDAIEWLKQ